MNRRARRQFLSSAILAGAALALPGLSKPKPNPNPKPPAKPQQSEISPTEDLMREHGVLRRVLLVYEQGVTELGEGRSVQPELFASSARLIQRFIEGYHEKLEEEQVFPRLEKLGKLSELTNVLLDQHKKGRQLTTEILKNATAAGMGRSGRRQDLMEAVRRFSRMYRPHAAWEDTVAFPAFHQLFTAAEFEKLGDLFEEQEHQMLGTGGFESTMAELGQLEKAAGIDRLSFYTPS